MAGKRYRKSLPAATLFMIPLSLLTACDSSSVVMSGTANGGNIANGSAYDQVIIPVGTIETLIVPENAKVLPIATDNQIHLYIKKTLAWSGQPTMPTDIRYERYRMGCGIRRDADAITLATYGEWNSKAEGGATIDLAVIVPPALKIERRKNLTGLDSPVEIQEPMFDSLQTRPLNAGWSRIQTQPDPTKGNGHF